MVKPMKLYDEAFITGWIVVFSAQAFGAAAIYSFIIFNASGLFATVAVSLTK